LRNPPRKQQELAKETIKIDNTTKANSNAENIFSRHERKKEKKKVTKASSTIISTLLEHLFKNFEPCWIIINNENAETGREGFAPGRREAVLHESKS